MRIERPHSQYFRYAGPGVLVAKAKASQPRTPFGRALSQVRRVLFGRPLASEDEIDERLSKKKALAIFSSDAISSSAYATEEILRVVVVAGAAALALSMPIAIAIALLLAVVSTSYRQIGFAYPSGGGAYAVARRNLGVYPALIAAAALLVDYVLTVAVSISSAVEQMISAIPELGPERVLIAVVAIVLMTVGNLRGLRESGNIFALPTYLFIGGALLMIAIGAFRIVVLGERGAPPDPLPGVHHPLEPITAFLILRAFASGSVALTGTEAIANGVPAFKPPEPKNAAATLTAMAVVLGVLFIGITFVADGFGIVPIDVPEVKTVISQVAARVYGDGSPAFFAFQAFTALILVLAANTSFNAFPRLGAVLAKDGFMPRQFMFRGDRLAFTVGIVLLSAAAIALVVLFGGNTTALIPLYAVGVFVSFTISQFGMVRHWRRERGPRWPARLAINAFGAVLTGVVAVVVTVAKAPTSLLVALIIPLLVLMMQLIRREYEGVGQELALRPDQIIQPPHRHERVIVPVPGLSRAVVQATNFGRAISADVRAVHITDDLEAASKLKHEWERQIPGVPLIIVESPFRSLVEPFIAYLDVMSPPEQPDTITIVVLPEYVPRHWWERLLYNQVANRLREALLGRPDTVVATVPYRRESRWGRDN